MSSTSPMSAPEIFIYAKEGQSSSQGSLYSNGRAQFPISVFIQEDGTTVQEVGLCEWKEATDLYPEDLHASYPMPSHVAWEKVDNINDRNYKSFPGQPSVTPPPTSYDSEHTFLVTGDMSLSVGSEHVIKLMAYAKLSNYYPEVGSDPQEVYWFSDIHASNSAGSAIDTDSTKPRFVEIKLVGKPSISFKMDGSRKSLSTYGSSGPGVYDGGLYHYICEYSDVNESVEVKTKSIENFDSNNNVVKTLSINNFHTNPSDDVYIIGKDGQNNFGQINKIARAVVHGFHESIEVTQEIDGSDVVYNDQKDGNAIMTASAYFLKDASIYENDAHDGKVYLVCQLTVEDFYGGVSQMRIKPSLKAANGGYARIDDLSQEVLTN